jgi:hypothetical protein
MAICTPLSVSARHPLARSGSLHGIVSELLRRFDFGSRLFTLAPAASR